MAQGSNDLSTLPLSFMAKLYWTQLSTDSPHIICPHSKKNWSAHWWIVVCTPCLSLRRRKSANFTYWTHYSKAATLSSDGTRRLLNSLILPWGQELIIDFDKSLAWSHHFRMFPLLEFWTSGFFCRSTRQHLDWFRDYVIHFSSRHSLSIQIDTIIIIIIKSFPDLVLAYFWKQLLLRNKWFTFTVLQGT